MRPLGASVVPGGVRFEVWAPKARTVEALVLRGAGAAEAYRLEPVGDGLFRGTAPGVGAGARYRYRLDGGPAYPDPYSRDQPEGVHGPSRVVDPAAFRWRDAAWPGLDPRRLVVYECHVGTMTPEGTFDALVGQLGELKRLGATALELMPVGTFPGRWNWGYDGTYPYAPCAVYGGPEGLRRLVDAAHRRGLGVILDVVYNHLGPEGNYLRVYSDDYFTDRYQTPWGEALNYDGPNATWVRRWAIANACHWVREYHLDGLRLDAVHAIHDASPRHLVAELAAAVRAVATRPVVLIAESDANDVRLIAPAARGGYGLDAVWADDFHHAVHTYLTGERDGYYEDYSGRLADVGRALGQGFLYQGERSAHLGRPRGTRVTDEPAERFVFCLQNHDQVGNRAFGERLHHLIDRERYAVATAVLLLAPETPLLFMGQEFAASAPFQYFTDHPPELGRLVTAGRRNEFRRFQAFADPARRAQIPDPQAEATFLRSKLDLGERARNRAVYRLYRDLLRLRRTDPVFADPSRERLAAWTPAADLLLVHRWRGGEHRLLVANFGSERTVPLEAPPGRARPAGAWRVWLSTAARRYGGAGRGARVERRAGGPSVRIAARTAALLACGSDAG